MAGPSAAAPTRPASRLRGLPRGRHGLSREEVGASQRRRIAGAVASVVAERGYAGATVSEIAARAGVSTRAFYEHFDGKEECFLAAFDAAAGRVADRLRDELEGSGGGPLARIERAIELCLEALSAEPERTMAFLVEAHGAGPRALERRAAAQAAFAEQLGALLAEAGKEPGHVAPPPLAGEALTGAIAAMVTGRIAAGRTERLLDLHLPAYELARRLVGERRAIGAA